MPIKCNECGKSNTIRYGLTFNKSGPHQRYLCKDCGHVFTEEYGERIMSFFSFLKGKPDPEKIEMEKWYNGLEERLDNEFKDCQWYMKLNESLRTRLIQQIDIRILEVYYVVRVYEWNEGIKGCHINTPDVCIAGIKRYFERNECNPNAIYKICEMSIKAEMRDHFNPKDEE